MFRTAWGVIEVGAMIRQYEANAGRVRLPPNHRTQEGWLAGRLALPGTNFNHTPLPEPCELLLDLFLL